MKKQMTSEGKVSGGSGLLGFIPLTTPGCRARASSGRNQVRKSLENLASAVAWVTSPGLLLRVQEKQTKL